MAVCLAVILFVYIKYRIEINQLYNNLLNYIFYFLFQLKLSAE